MTTFIIAAIITSVLLILYAVYRLVRLIRSLFRPSQPPRLMKVGQVAPPPVPAEPTPDAERPKAAYTPMYEAKPAPLESAPFPSLFPGLGVPKRDDRLPVIEPAQTPIADGSDYSFGPITPLLAALLPETPGRREELKTDLKRAGQYQPHAFENIQATRYLFLMIPLFMLGLLMTVVPQRLELWVLGTMLAVAIVGWAAPQLYIRSQAADRKAQIERSLPDVLDMLNMCVSQGMTLVPALKRVTSELRSPYPALSQELQIVAEQAELGTLEQALENFNDRVDAPDVHSFTNLLIQTERMGTSITAALTDYADNMRESLRQRADEKANRATFQLLFPTVLCLMPAVYMFLLGPSIIRLTDFFSGRTSTATQQVQNNYRPIQTGQ